MFCAQWWDNIHKTPWSMLPWTDSVCLSSHHCCEMDCKCFFNWLPTAWHTNTQPWVAISSVPRQGSGTPSVSWASLLCHCNKENVFHAETVSCSFQNSPLPVSLQKVCVFVLGNEEGSLAVFQTNVSMKAVRAAYPREGRVLRARLAICKLLRM